MSRNLLGGSSQYVVNDHGDRKSPIPGVVGPLPNGLFMAYKSGLLSNYLLKWDDPPGIPQLPVVPPEAVPEVSKGKVHITQNKDVPIGIDCDFLNTPNYCSTSNENVMLTWFSIWVGSRYYLWFGNSAKQLIWRACGTRRISELSD